MEIVKYYEKEGRKKFNCEQALQDGWHFDNWEDFEKEIPFTVMHKRTGYTTEVVGHSDFMGIVVVNFKNNSYLALDHAVEAYIRLEK